MRLITGNFLYTLIFILILHFWMAGILSLFMRIIHCTTFYTSIAVFASKILSDQRVGIFHFNIPVQWYPFFMIFIYYINGSGRIGLRTIGTAIFIGSFIFYLLYVMPVITGKAFLRTPKVLTTIFG